MNSDWRLWSPYTGLIVKDFSRIRMYLFVAVIFSLLAAGIFYSRSFKVLNHIASSSGTYLEILRYMLPYLCLACSIGFAKKLISEDLDSQSWRFHHQLPVSPAAQYLVKFSVGLLALVFCTLCLQFAFLLASKDEIFITWKHVAYPGLRITAYAMCMWSFFLLATSFGSFRWFAYGGLTLLYYQVDDGVPPFNLINYEGSLEEVSTLAPTGSLISSGVITLIGLLGGMALAHFQRTEILGFLNRRMPPVMKIFSIAIALMLVFIILFGLRPNGEANIGEKKLTAFGQTFEIASKELQLEAWMPVGSENPLKNITREALEQLPSAASTFLGYVQTQFDLPKCVVILRPDLIEESDWQVEFYDNSQAVVIRIFPDLKHYDQLTNIIANYYFDEVVNSGLLHMPIAMENFGWLACGLASYLFPVGSNVIQFKHESWENAIDWLRDHDLSNWPEARNGFYDDEGSYNSEPRLSPGEMTMVSWAILKALRERHGEQLVQALCREALVLDSTLPKAAGDFPILQIKAWPGLLEVAARAKFRTAIDILQKKGGSIEGLEKEALSIMEERIVQ